MVKENSIIAIGSHDDKPDYDYSEDVELRIYSLLDNKEASTKVYSMDNQLDLTATAIKVENEITITTSSTKSYSIRLVNVIVTRATGATITIDGNDTILSAEIGTSSIKVNI